MSAKRCQSEFKGSLGNLVKLESHDKKEKHGQSFSTMILWFLLVPSFVLCESTPPLLHYINTLLMFLPKFVFLNLYCQHVKVLFKYGIYRKLISSNKELITQHQQLLNITHCLFFPTTLSTTIRQLTAQECIEGFLARLLTIMKNCNIFCYFQ